MLAGAVGMMAMKMYFCMASSQCRDMVFDTAGVERDYSDAMKENFLTVCATNPEKMVSVLLYNSFGDDKTCGYYSGYSKAFPRHQKNLPLDALYKWLVSCGYEMSDDERMLQDGTHPLFVDKDKNQT